MYLNEWGPIAWELFHYITYTYKPELKEYYTIFFTTLYSIIPCPHCSNDIKGILTSSIHYPSHFTLNKDEIINWYIRIHNLVNKKLKAPFTFSRNDADNKYLKNNDIPIDHKRILKFIKLSITTKGQNKQIDTDLAFKRNIIALCCIYPIGVNLYNPNLMFFINYANITNAKYNEWYSSFERLVLNNTYYKPFDTKIKYPIRDLTYNDPVLKHLELFSNSKNKIFNTNNRLIIKDYPKDRYSTMVVNSSDNKALVIHKTYKIYNNLNSLDINISGRSFSKNGYINIISNILYSKKNNVNVNQIKNKDTYLKITYENIKRNDIITLLFEYINKEKGDQFLINDICLIGT